MLYSYGVITPYKVEHVDMVCTIDEWKPIHPFAYRVHTHSLGKVVSGYSVNMQRKADIWTLLGKQNPQTHQSFYPVMNNVTMIGDDILAARCTMESYRDHNTNMG